MTDDQIRIAIAEACGWTRGNTGPTHWVNDPHGIRRGWSSMRDVADSALPDYLNDLNACAEFEKNMTDEEWRIYSAEIVSLTLWDRATDTVKRILQANARQRCLAFLKTKGIQP